MEEWQNKSLMIAEEAIRQQAKKEVFDDIWNTWAKKYGDNHTSNEAIFDMHNMIRELEKHHLSTSQSKGNELSFKVPSQSSDKPCPRCNCNTKSKWHEDWGPLSDKNRLGQGSSLN